MHKPEEDEPSEPARIEATGHLATISRLLGAPISAFTGAPTEPPHEDDAQRNAEADEMARLYLMLDIEGRAAVLALARRLAGA